MKKRQQKRAEGQDAPGTHGQDGRATGEADPPQHATQNRWHAGWGWC